MSPGTDRGLGEARSVMVLSTTRIRKERVVVKMPQRSYTIRVFRPADAEPGAVAGVIEEDGVKGRRLFSNIDELMMILEGETDSAPFIQYEVAEERRKEARKMREARFNFVHRGKMFPGSLVDCSEGGLCVRFPEGTPLSAGQGMDLLLDGTALKSLVRWVIICCDPPSTTVGIEVPGGLGNGNVTLGGIFSLAEEAL